MGIDYLLQIYNLVDVSVIPFSGAVVMSIRQLKMHLPEIKDYLRLSIVLK